MKHYLCNACGMSSKKELDACPLCGSRDLSIQEDTSVPSETDKKEHALMESALSELEEYEEGLEPVSKKYYNSGE